MLIYFCTYYLANSESDESSVVWIAGYKQPNSFWQTEAVVCQHAAQKEKTYIHTSVTLVFFRIDVLVLTDNLILNLCFLVAGLKFLISQHTLDILCWLILLWVYCV